MEGRMKERNEGVSEFITNLLKTKHWLYITLKIKFKFSEHGIQTVFNLYSMNISSLIHLLDTVIILNARQFTEYSMLFYLNAFR